MRISLTVDNMDEGDSDSGVPLWSIPALELALCNFIGAIWSGSIHYEVIEISVSLLSKEEIRYYNRRYRQTDEPTDVLSFPMWEEDGIFTPPDSMDLLPLGDILICPAIVKQNVSYIPGRNYYREISLMLAHGILHLLGMDHDTPERKKQMWDLQASLSGEIEKHANGREISFPAAGGCSDV